MSVPPVVSRAERLKVLATTPGVALTVEAEDRLGVRCDDGVAFAMVTRRLAVGAQHLHVTLDTRPIDTRSFEVVIL